MNGYLPTSAIWYSLSDDRYGQQIGSGHAEFPAPKDKHIPVFVRGMPLLGENGHFLLPFSRRIGRATPSACSNDHCDSAQRVPATRRTG